MKPLTEMELKLRKICRENSLQPVNHYITREGLDKLSNKYHIDFASVFPIPLIDSLDESSLFAKDENVGIVEHARYMPPLLHSHAFFELAYVREGSCIHVMDEKAHTLVAGDIVIIAPNHQHAISAFTDEADIINLQIRTSTFEKSFFGILTDKDVLSEFFMHCLYNIKDQTCITFKTGDDAILKGLSESLSDEYKSSRKYRSRMMDSLISTFFIQLLRAHEKDVVLDPNSNSAKDDNLILMLQYIQNNYANLSLNELARFFGYSPRHMARLIKESTGKSFTEITKDLRMKRAAELLENKDLPIPSIMESVGFSDVSTFYKAFKSYYGMPPAAYREQL